MRRPIPSLLPRLKRERQRVEILSGAVIVVFVLLALGVFWASSLQQRLLRSPNVAAVVATILAELANQDRAQNDLATLTVNPVLVAAAQAKANDMAEKGYFAHTSPEGVDPWHWFKEADYRFDYAGENLAVDFSDSGDVNTAWMNSPTHRENILGPHFTEIGIATAQGMYQGRLTTFVVQEFGTPAGTSGQKSVAAATVPKNPTALATASTRPAEPAVLGTSAEEPGKAPAGNVSTDVTKLAPVATTSPVVAAYLAQETRTSPLPLWGYLVSFPRAAMHLAYYALAFLVIFALLVDTGFEMRSHHRKKAYHAGLVLVVVSVLFVMADYFFFAQPVLASLAASL